MTEPAVESLASESNRVIPRADVGTSWRAFLLQVCGVSLLFACLLVAYARWRTGSFSLAWPYLTGATLIFEPRRISLGVVPRATRTVEKQLRVINIGSKAIQLLGAERSCGCIALDEFPIVVPAGEERLLRLRIGMPQEPKPFGHTIKFFSDEHGYSSVSVVVMVSGSVL